MIIGLDSSFDRPSLGQLMEARAAGIQQWSGYLATRGGTNLAAPWSFEDFQRVKQVMPAPPLAYCSGHDDPAGCQQLAQSWGVLLCLDVEDGIRGDGDWVAGWLASSGAGLYSNRGTCMRYSAPFYVMAAYPTDTSPEGDPGATWQGQAPDAPHGWQWQNTHTEFGCGVDRAWMDDWFLTAQEDDMFSDEDRQLLGFVKDRLNAITGPRENGEWPTLAKVEEGVAFTSARLNNISEPTAAGVWPTLGKLTDAVNQLLEKQGLPPIS